MNCRKNYTDFYLTNYINNSWNQQQLLEDIFDATESIKNKNKNTKKDCNKRGDTLPAARDTIYLTARRK